MGKTSSLLLASLIEDILDLSRMEAGTFKINYSQFAIAEVFEEVSDIFSFQCSQKKITFSIELCEELKKAKVLSDKGRVKQILLNLVSNSLKFTFKGGIKIS